jgi:hypothetical protein
MGLRHTPLEALEFARSWQAQPLTGRMSVAHEIVDRIDSVTRRNPPQISLELRPGIVVYRGLIRDSGLVWLSNPRPLFCKNTKR